MNLDSLLHQSWNLVWQLALLAALFVPLERLFSLRRAEILRPQIFNDLGYYVLNGLVLGALMALPIAGLAIASRAIVPDVVIRTATELPLWARVPLVLFIGDIGAYWGHRWCHSNKWLWRLHVIHHSAEHIDWLVNTRVHPFELVFTRLCGLVPLFALGLAQTTNGINAMPALLLTLGLLWACFIHANVRWRFGWLEQIVSTPAFHHWHHTNDEMRDHNFAALFPVVDRIFGTFYLPKSYPSVYGVNQPPDPSLLGQLTDPLLPAAQRAS